MYIYICVCVYMSVCIYICPYICICIRMCKYIYICICIYMYIYIYICIYVYIRICICIWIRINTYRPRIHTFTSPKNPTLKRSNWLWQVTSHVPGGTLGWERWRLPTSHNHSEEWIPPKAVTFQKKHWTMIIWPNYNISPTQISLK